MEKLILETEQSAGVEIRRNASPLPELSMEQKNILYLALREGITNGIKHGKCTAFELQLSYDEPLVVFRLKNNGKPLEGTKHGFGLQAMKQRIEKAGGWLRLASDNEWNVVVDIRLPV